MTKETSTYSNQKMKDLTIKDMKKWANMIMKKEEKPLPKGLSWFSKLMNKFGWYRKYEIIIFDRSKFKVWTSNHELSIK